MQKKVALSYDFLFSFVRRRLFLAVLVSLVEFVDATGGVNELDLASVEGVRGVGDLNLHDRVLDAVHHESLFGLSAGTGDEHGLV